MSENPLLKIMGLNLERAMFDMKYDMAEAIFMSEYARHGIKGFRSSIDHPRDEREAAWVEWNKPENREKRRKADEAREKKERKKQEEFAKLMLHIYAPDQVYSREIHGVIDMEDL